MDSRLRLLVTSIGSLVGHGVHLCLAPVRERIHLIGTNSVADAAPSFACDVAYMVPPTAEREAYIEAHERIVRAERPDMILPTRDAELEVLPSLIERLPPGERPIYVGSSAAVARIAADKLETWRFAVAQGLAMAETAGDRDGAHALARDRGFPLVAKPRRGFGSRGIFLVRDGDEIDRVGNLGTHVFQEFVGDRGEIESRSAIHRIALPLFHAPEERNVVAMLIADAAGRPLHAMAEVSVLESGRCVAAHPSDEPALLDAAGAWAAALAPLGFAGPINLQGRNRPTGAFALFELAMRVNGGSPGRMVSGFNDVLLSLNAMLPAERRLPVPMPLRRGRVVALAHPHLVADDDRTRLEADGRWRRSRANPANAGNGS